MFHFLLNPSSCLSRRSLGVDGRLSIRGIRRKIIESIMHMSLFVGKGLWRLCLRETFPRLLEDELAKAHDERRHNNRFWLLSISSFGTKWSRTSLRQTSPCGNSSERRLNLRRSEDSCTLFFKRRIRRLFCDVALPLENDFVRYVRETTKCGATIRQAGRQLLPSS
jgi:hypothetical protein